MKELVPFVDLSRQTRELHEELRTAIDAVVARGDFILGEAVERFESDFAAWIGSRHAVGVGNGLDALRLTLLALGIGDGDEVILPVNTFSATALAVTAVGATPVLVDCLDSTQQIDADQVAAAVTPRTRALIPVHLHGHPADMAAIAAIATRHGLAVVEDSAQAHGAGLGNQACGTFGVAGCFSFYPAKNLGAFGDGGLVVTDDEALADRLRALRNYGQSGKNLHTIIGGNSRLDTLQAAVLAVKLGHLDRWNAERVAAASLYTQLLSDTDERTPLTAKGARHVFHLYVLRSRKREALRAHLLAAGIQTGIHYPVPIHLQPAYEKLGYPRGRFPVAERLATEILSLPMFPGLRRDEIERVAGEIHAFARSRSGEGIAGPSR